MAKRGRKKINCLLGKQIIWTCRAYPFEVQQLKIEFNKLKQQRKKYYIKEEEHDKTTE